MARQYWTLFVACFVSVIYFGIYADEDKGLVNLNLRINRLNLTRYFEDGRVRMKNPFFFNLDIPNIFTMNLDTKKNDGTSLGLRVLNPLNRFLKIFGVDGDQRRTEEGWALTRRTSKRGEEEEEVEESGKSEKVNKNLSKEKSIDELKKENEEP